jgi:excisionase family DNA binding protein
MTRLEDAVAELVAALRAEVEATTGRPERLLSVEQAADALGIGRTLLLREAAAGRIVTVKVGKRRLVSESALADYIAARTADAA